MDKADERSGKVAVQTDSRVCHTSVNCKRVKKTKGILFVLVMEKNDRMSEKT